jgi:hypothetical protein
VAVGSVLGLLIGAAVPAPSNAAVRCVAASEARSAGGDSGPPRFSAGFFARRITMEASTDGLTDGTLPISIETVCGLPRAYEKQGAQLPGTDGVATITTRTSVWMGSTRLTADRKFVELESADTVRLRVRLLPPASWKADEDGNQVPTFSTSRAVITD